MSFNSWLFLLAFLPASLLCASVVRRLLGVDAAWRALILLSAFFIAAAGVIDAAVLALSVTVNFLLSGPIGNGTLPRKARARWLRLAVAFNVILLTVFKFAVPLAGAFVGDASALLPMLPHQIPLGLSFYTISQCIYLVDLSDDVVPRQRVLDYASFVSFFPNVTAGPILRLRTFASQRTHVGQLGTFPGGPAAAVLLICFGLVKKVAIGDSFSRVSSVAFSEAGNAPTFGDAWLMALSATFEVYFDFSGYSDIAFGIAGLMGLTLVQNFRAPYTATDISDFWRRWHISLSEFITAYLYTPLLRSLGRPTIHTSAAATLIAMLAAGLWHGASWNYVAFGALHGLALAGYQYWKRVRRPLPENAARVLTFAFVAIAFVTVKSASLRQSIAVWAGMLDPFGHEIRVSVADSIAALPDGNLILAAVALGVPLAFIGPTADAVAARAAATRLFIPSVFAALVVAFIFMIGGAGTEFRYRQF